MRKNRIDLLTCREKQVMELVAEGLSNKEIEEKLVISANTVSTHLVHIYNKLKVQRKNTTDVSVLRLRLVLKWFEMQDII